MSNDKQQQRDQPGNVMDDPCSPLPTLTGSKWLIERRWRIQSLCLELHSYLEKNEIPVKADWQFFSPLLAAAFSLWRAAFLADPNRTRDDIYEHAKTFFKILIEDNAINYPQDRTTRAYSAGYYLNNAKFRLQEVWDRIPHDIYEPDKKKELQDLWFTDLDSNSPPNAWDQLYVALCLALRFHQKFR